MWVLCSGLLEHDFLPLYNPLHLITMPWGLLADRIIAWDGWNIKNTTARSTQLRCWKLQKHHKYHKSVNNNALECCQQQGRPNTAKSTTAMLFDSKWVKRVGESESWEKRVQTKSLMKMMTRKNNIIPANNTETYHRFYAICCKPIQNIIHIRQYTLRRLQLKTFLGEMWDTWSCCKVG